jgi:hypothetical protein
MGGAGTIQAKQKGFNRTKEHLQAKLRTETAPSNQTRWQAGGIYNYIYILYLTKVRNNGGPTLLVSGHLKVPQHHCWFPTIDFSTLIHGIIPPVWLIKRGHSLIQQQWVVDKP